jgi:hypothetical protein
LGKSVKLPVPRSVGRVIATRRLRMPGRIAHAVTIRMGVPRRLRGGWDWGCPVEIIGLDAPHLRYVFGVDAFQALQLGLNYIAIRASTASVHPYWFEPGDGAGFTRSLPSYLPLTVQQELQSVVDKRSERWLKRQARRGSPGRRKRPVR